MQWGKWSDNWISLMITNCTQAINDPTTPDMAPEKMHASRWSKPRRNIQEMATARAGKAQIIFELP